VHPETLTKRTIQTIEGVGGMSVDEHSGSPFLSTLGLVATRSFTSSCRISLAVGLQAESSAALELHSQLDAHVRRSMFEF